MVVNLQEAAGLRELRYKTIRQLQHSLLRASPLEHSFPLPAQSLRIPPAMPGLTPCSLC